MQSIEIEDVVTKVGEALAQGGKSDGAWEWVSTRPRVELESREDGR